MKQNPTPAVSLAAVEEFGRRKDAKSAMITVNNVTLTENVDTGADVSAVPDTFSVIPYSGLRSSKEVLSESSVCLEGVQNV